MTAYAIGVDIGGTNTKLALVDLEGRLHQRAALPTPREADPEQFTAAIIAAAGRFLAQAEEAGFTVSGLGFTVPHYPVGADWVQRQTNNLPALEGFALYPPLRQAFGPSIAMLNDVSAAGIAEHLFGQGRGVERMLLMAIGTGISIAFINETGLVAYLWGTAGDTGHLIVDPDGLADCTCGGRGCLEALASAPAIRRRALREIERGKPTSLAEAFKRQGDLEASDVSAAARAGDPVANDILEQTGRYLGIALASYLHIFCPSRIVLGGGVAQAGDLLIHPIRATLERLASPWYLARLQGIELAALGVNAAAIGCASLILYPGRYVR